MANGHGAHGRPSEQQAGYSPQGSRQDGRRSYQQTHPQDYQRRAAVQAPVRGGYRPLTPDANQYSHYNNRYQGRKKKKHTVRNVLLTLLVIVVIVGAAGGYTGWTLYNSAKQVRSDASVVMSDISDLKGQILGEQGEAANATARDIATRSENMRKETSGWAWTVASFVPVYGEDVNMVRDLAGVLDDLADNAITPLVNEVSQVSIKNLIQDDGSINVDLAKRLVYVLVSSAPVIERSTQKLDSMGEAHLDQINGPLAKAREKIGKLNTVTQFAAGIAPTFTQMLGADGQPRTYLIVAQNNAEIHATGGFLGSIGPLYLTDGRIELGDFRYIYDIYPAEGAATAPLTDEELAIFGTHVRETLGNTGWLPDWRRVGEIEAYYWEAKGYGHVDGLIGVDPVFLQQMLALAGPVTLSNGIVLDGSNAARYLLHEVYYLPVDQQDPLFEETAKLAFQQIMSHLGDVDMMTLAKQVKAGIDAKRLQVWMANEDEEEALSVLGCQGSMDGTSGAPTVGIYVNDYSYCKLYWYLKTTSAVGPGVKNADGTTTYPVTATLSNMVANEGELSDYMAANNPTARSRGEMMMWLYLSAPTGATISNLSSDFFSAMYEGHELHYGTSSMLPGETVTLTFDVTLPAGADDAPVVAFSPNAQEVAGW